MAYIRKAYGVPAKRGGRVEYTGCGAKETGTITGADGHYLRVRLDGEKEAGNFHPTWALRYLTPNDQLTGRTPGQNAACRAPVERLVGQPDGG
jgi:hypothetical protein